MSVDAYSEWDSRRERRRPLELSPVPGKDQAVHTEAVVEVSVELSALPAAERVVVHSPVKMQALAVVGRPRPRLLPSAAAGVVRAQSRYVPVRQLVHQSEGPLSAGGPRAKRRHVAVKVIETRSGGGGQPCRRRRRRALVVFVHGFHLRRRRPQELGAVRGLHGARRHRRPAVLQLRDCGRSSSSGKARVRPSFPFPPEVSIVKHFFAVGIQRPIVSFSCKEE